MRANVLQATVEKRGLVFDPRTKLLLLIAMTTFVLGGAGQKSGFGGIVFSAISVILCFLPFLLLLAAKRRKAALRYAILYLAMYVIFIFVTPQTRGILNFFILGTSGIITRFMPSILLGFYVVSSTTVSEFTAAMQKMHISEKIIIPLSVMFRFFPTVGDEFRCINQAMRMRGIVFGGKNMSKMLEYRLVPLLSCSVKIGEELSAAALTRGLGGTVKRTNVCEIGFHMQDWVVFLLCATAYFMLILSKFGVL